MSYDPGTGVVLGTFRVGVLDPQDRERKKSLFVSSVARDVDDCRFWVKVILSAELAPLFRGKSVAKISSGAFEVLVVKLENYVYSLWSRRGAGTLRLIPVSRAPSWRPGDLAGLVRPCAELPELLDSVCKDLAELRSGST